MSQDRYANNSTNYVHPQESNLLNVHKAMEYNDAGEPVLRTSIGTSTINISGPVTIPGSVEISNDEGNPVPISGTVEISSATVYQGTDPWNITGSVSVTELPPITGTVEVSNFPLVQEITGTVIVTQGTDPWNITGTVFVENFTSTVYQGTDPWVVTGNVTATITGTSTVTLGTGVTDAFGRLRVSEPYTLFDSRTRYYDHNDFSSSTSTGGLVVYDPNGSTFQLFVSTLNGSSVIRETKKVFPYQPGKSLLILCTFAMNTPKTGLRQRVGYFTTNNGIYFENDGSYNYLVIRSYSSGTLTENRVRQDNWDNPFLSLSVDNTQIFWTDIEWLGVGSVRCGFVVNGQYVLCHTFNHANISGNTSTYMTTAILPVRYEITNTAVTTSTSMLRQICSSVISEGGYNAFSTSETAGTGITPFRLVTAGTYYPLVSIRLASSRLDSIVLPRQVDILSPTVNYYRWQLLQNATLTGATWTGTSYSGTVEYDTGARVNAVTGGIELASGYIASRELSVLGADFFSFQLGRTLQGQSDVITLAISATSNNADVLAQIGWQEVT